MALVKLHPWLAKLLYFSLYCNGDDERIARQQLGKQLSLVLHDKNGESIVVANVTVRCQATAL
jgi:hypothetical protein